MNRMNDKLEVLVTDGNNEKVIILRGGWEDTFLHQVVLNFGRIEDIKIKEISVPRKEYDTPMSALENLDTVENLVKFVKKYHCLEYPCLFDLMETCIIFGSGDLKTAIAHFEERKSFALENVENESGECELKDALETLKWFEQDLILAKEHYSDVAVELKKNMTTKDAISSSEWQKVLALSSVEHSIKLCFEALNQAIDNLRKIKEA